MNQSKRNHSGLGRGESDRVREMFQDAPISMSMTLLGCSFVAGECTLLTMRPWGHGTIGPWDAWRPIGIQGNPHQRGKAKKSICSLYVYWSISLFRNSEAFAKLGLFLVASNFHEGLLICWKTMLSTQWKRMCSSPDPPCHNLFLLPLRPEGAAESSCDVAEHVNRL